MARHLSENIIQFLRIPSAFHVIHVLAGTHADNRGLGRLLGLMTTVAGMLIFALMIGVVSDSIGARVDSLKKGNAKVKYWRLLPPNMIQ